MNLREGLENEFAEVLHDHGPGPSGKPPSKDWRDCFRADAHGGTAPRLVDALVGFLKEHADEWWETAKTLPQFEAGGPTMERRLLAVLASEDPEDCDGSGTCEATTHTLGCYRSMRESDHA